MFEFTQQLALLHRLRASRPLWHLARVQSCRCAALLDRSKELRVVHWRLHVFYHKSRCFYGATQLKLRGRLLLGEADLVLASYARLSANVEAGAIVVIGLGLDGNTSWVPRGHATYGELFAALDGDLARPWYRAADQLTQRTHSSRLDVASVHNRADASGLLDFHLFVVNLIFRCHLLVALLLGTRRATSLVLGLDPFLERAARRGFDVSLVQLAAVEVLLPC